MHQEVNVRVGAGPYRFVDEQAEKAHTERMQAFRAAIPSHVKYVVGPDGSIQGANGKVFAPGSPITADDVSGDEGWPLKGRAPWRVFEDLVHEQLVVENYSFAAPIEGDPNLMPVPAAAALRG